MLAPRTLMEVDMHMHGAAYQMENDLERVLYRAMDSKGDLKPLRPLGVCVNQSEGEPDISISISSSLQIVQ